MWLFSYVYIWVHMCMQVYICMWAWSPEDNFKVILKKAMCLLWDMASHWPVAHQID